MADEKRGRPKSLDRRYGRLSEDKKNTYFAVKTHLGYEPEEWEELPWWKQRMWVEKLNEKFATPEDDPSASSPPAQVSPGDEVYDDVTVLGITPQAFA